VLPSRIRRNSHPPRTANCHEEQLDERYRAQAEHIGTKLAEIDAVIVPAAPDLPPFTLAEGPQGDVELVCPAFSGRLNCVISCCELLV